MSANRTLFARHALLPQGWSKNVRLEIDARGTFAAVSPDSLAEGCETIEGFVVPGMPNAHSHAFQRALAGRTQRGSDTGDDFWSWREAMYRFVERIDPDGYEAVVTQSFREMLRAGYTSVAEFHYVHHAAGGRRYENLCEMSERVMAAAAATGIRLTLLPVLYCRSDFDEREPAPPQRRFINDVPTFFELWRRLRALAADKPAVRIGIGVHSLRAVGPEQLRQLVEVLREEDSSALVHVHVAEQRREVESARRHLGAAPIRWLLHNAPVSEGWTLVHATHADAEERADIIRSGAVVTLCPTTEADLGDGIFPAAEFFDRGGRIAIGSDSNTIIDVAEELRWLEYGQRLSLEKRATMWSAPLRSVGESIYRKALLGGAQALGGGLGELRAGCRADFITLQPLDREDGSPSVLDRFVFAPPTVALGASFVAGNKKT